MTLTGPGGIGKTRLAVAVGRGLRDRFDAGTAFVALVMANQADQVLVTIGRAVGADLAGIHSVLDGLVEYLGAGRWLLILDNLEQVPQAGPQLDALLAACPGLAIIATSRTVLDLAAERAYPVPPLSTPADAGDLSPAELATVPAVALFLDRARAVRHDFELTSANVPVVLEICRRLEGLPLAIELAASRTRLLDPDALLSRLLRSLDALGTATPDRPERQRTLRATVDWSVNLLDDASRSLLETAAVFVDGWTIDAAASVAGLDEDRALDLTETLIEHSLIRSEQTDTGPRCRMLETIRAFVTERLAARPDRPEITRRHADYYRNLANQADVHLRGTDHQWWERLLAAETGNLATAVRWYLQHDRPGLPHLLRILFPFWASYDHSGETFAWVSDLLNGHSPLSPLSTVELLVVTAMSGSEAGDDDVALAAADQLGPLIDGIEDPFLQALSRLAIAWTAPIRGDLSRAAQAASACLDQLRQLDEPFWTTVAVATLGNIEMTAGHDDAALVHLGEFRDRADARADAWLVAWSRAQLGNLAVVQHRLDDARALIDDAFDLSSAAHSLRGMVLALTASALLYFVDGDAERAATLAGAIQGLRHRAGLRTWPPVRQAEVELLREIRGALGAHRFDQAAESGARLSLSDAVAMARAGTATA